MLRRRITKHVEAQNWFAVGIDFVIVVIGVFMGLQVQNWNEGRQALEQEAQVLEQLHTQFAVFISETEKSIAEQRASRDATIEILAVIETGAPPIDGDAFKITLLEFNSLKRASPKPTALAELVSAGRLSDLSSPDLRTSLTSFYQTYSEHEETSATALAIITSPQNPYNRIVSIDPDQPKQILRYDLEQLQQLRPTAQSLLFGKRMTLAQMEELKNHAVSIQEEIDRLID